MESKQKNAASSATRLKITDDHLKENFYKIQHLLKPRMAKGPGGQDQTCRPVTNAMIHYELGLRNYVKTSKFKPNKPWNT